MNNWQKECLIIIMLVGLVVRLAIVTGRSGRGTRPDMNYGGKHYGSVRYSS